MASAPAKLLAFALLVCWPADGARNPLVDGRIALRSGGGKLLIIGDPVKDEATASLVEGGLKRFRALEVNPTLCPGEANFEIPPEVLQKLLPKAIEGFALGAQWQVYPGAGPPFTIAIEKLALLYHGNGTTYTGAMGRIASPSVANRIAGLSAAEYLAVPGDVIPGISEIPMILVEQPGMEVMKLLVDRAHEMVHDDNWQLEGTRDPNKSSGSA